MSRRLELRRVATMWDCQADFEVEGPWTAIMWEPLDVQAPLEAKPYCCYVDTVIFYRDRVGYDEVARCRHHELNMASPSLVFLGGRWWEVGGAHVVQRDGKWHMRWHLAANTRAAREANHGRELDRRDQLAQVN